MGWKHGTDVLGNGKKVKCNYCTKTISGGIFRFKRHLAGTREDSEPCAMVPEEVKILMMKIVAEAKETSMRKKRLVDIDEEDDIEKEMEMRALTKGKGVGGSGVQITLNQMMKKDYKDQVDQQVARYFYTSVIPFNSIKNVEFIKMCEMIGRYGIAVVPLMTVLRLVDSDEKPAMGFIYDGMDCAKEKIKINFGNVKKSYEPVWNIIDERWDKQLHRPLHAAAYYLNPHFHYDPNFRDDDVEVKQGLYNCMTRLLKKFAIRVLSLTCSSSGCERNWSSFEMVHTKRRNRLHQRKMNDLVYVMYNLKLKSKQVKRNLVIPFDELHSDDEWITEEGDAIFNGEDVQPPLRDENENVDDGGNVELVGDSTNPTLNDLEDLVFDDVNIEEPLSSDEEDELEENEDDDDAHAFVGGLDFD
uniref:BED-type domain-containing protein n=1 Tax=Cajanus cajan TaxID=3821 RepID=A0A151R761_CAJCA|nr:hypothetical protein KK1_040364 [Cajanus cajan]